MTATHLIAELCKLQDAHGYLSDDHLRELAGTLRVPLSEIEGVTSFYPHLRRTPPPAHRIEVCRDVVCRLRGGVALADRLRACAAGAGDVAFEEISCPGLCDAAPAGLLDGSRASADQIEASLAGRSQPAAPPPDRATVQEPLRLDPYAREADRYGVLRRWLPDFEPERVATRLEASGLRGMGGAGFPAGRKWRLVAAEPAHPHYVVCNADESEPGTFKDRVLLERAPHLVVEGIVFGGLAVGAEQGWVYLRHEYHGAMESLQQAITDARARGVLGSDVLGSGRAFDLEIFVSPGGYVLGEETALLEAMEGRRGEPRNKPPYPGVEGLHGRPTLINNVETFAQVPHALETGRADLKVYAVSGDVTRPGVVEAPLGTRLSELIERCGGMRDGRPLGAFLPGGASTGFLFAEHADLAMDWDSLAEVGSSLGTGAVVVVAAGADLLDLGRNIARFFRNESCGKCVPCRLGTEKALALLAAPGPDEEAQLARLDETLRETSLCGLGPVALTAARSVLGRPR